MSDDRIALLKTQWEKDKFKCHEDLFKHRHEHVSPAIHREIVYGLWGKSDRIIFLAFRGSGKSTRSEEFGAAGCCLEAFRFCLYIGASEARAAERLAAVSYELKTNDLIRTVFGELVGDPWTQTKLVLTNGICVMAMGRDQDIRGLKHLDRRPDFVIVDDFEDKDNVQTPEGRRKTLRWFLSELLPACDPRRKVRVLATPMDAESVPMLLARKPRPGWDCRVLPIEYVADSGDRRAAWPSRFPLDWIDREKSDYEALGEFDVWEREFMCNAVSDVTRVFKPEMIKVEPRVHTFEAKYAMIDPARTVRRTSATTGWAVWSWVRNRLIVWDAGAKLMMPDEIVDLAFRLAREHDLVEVGVEEDGLNEWLIQPIRARQITEGSIPLRAVRAPRGKTDFIRGLQPFFAGGECTFARDLPELCQQLLGFPTGRIDAPNALAYALQLRPGRVIYEDWNPNVHIRPTGIHRGSLVYLAANATRAIVTGVLVEIIGGRVAVLGDFVVEGNPGEAAEALIRSASVASGGRFTAILPPAHFDVWNNVGLAQAIRAFGVEVRAGVVGERGKDFIRRELSRNHGGEPGIVVSDNATWTLRAFSGGYARELRNGYPAEEATNNRYRVLMEGLESFAGLVAWGIEGETDNRNWVTDAQGRRYMSAMPARKQLNA